MALPQLGVEALFLIEKFQRNAKRYDRILGQAEKSGKKLADSTAKSTEQMARSYDELIKKSSELQRAMSEMSSKRQANLIEGLQGAFGKLGDTAGIDVSIFDKLVGSGESIGAAFQGATTSAAGFGGAALTLGAALTGVGIAAGLVATGISAAISVIKDSIATYQQSAEELRKMQMQLGGSTEEVSRLMQAAQLTGTQINHLAAGIGMFEKKMTDFDLRMAVGSEESHEFERALRTLGIEVKDVDSTMRPLNDILMDAADRFKDLGPGATTTGLAMNLFGRSGRQMLPFLMEGADGLQRFMEIAEKTGSVLTTKDTKAAYELQQAMTELDMSVQGVKNTLAREFVPAAEWVVDVLSEIAQGARTAATHLISSAASAAAYAETLIKTGSAIKAAAAMTEAYTAKTLQLSGALTEQEKAEEAAKLAAEARRQEIAKANLILEEATKREIELNKQRQEKILEAEIAFGRQWEDAIRQRGRQIEDAELSEARRREDLWRQYQRRLADIEEDFNKRREDQRRDNQKKLDDFWDRMNLRREKLLNRHLERMQAIRERFTFSANEAARRNDAVALLRAMRQRDLDFKLEKTRYKNRKAELEKDIALRLKKLKDSFEEQRRAEERRLEDAIEQAKKAYARQLEDLAIALERQEADRQRSWRRQEEDFDISMQRRDEDRQRWFDKERQEIDAQFAAANAILNAGYKTQEGMQKEHLDRMLDQRRVWREAEAAMSLQAPTPVSTPIPRSYIPRGAAPHFRAEGGMDVVSKPTTFVAGEAGPEVHAWAPVSNNVHHTFDRMGMDIGGVSSATEAQLAPLMVEMLSKMVRQIR